MSDWLCIGNFRLWILRRGHAQDRCPSQPMGALGVASARGVLAAWDEALVRGARGL